MNRLSRLVFVITMALGALVVMVPVPALADPIGGVIIIPGSGTNLDPLRLRTSAGCPAQATAYYATMRGHGFPPNGQTVTSETDAGLSHKIGFDVYVALVMRDYANKNHATLAGRYDITVYCVNGFTQNSLGEFTASLEFTSPTAYQALGTAMPVGPPPPPLEDPGATGPLDPMPPPVGSAPKTAPEADYRDTSPVGPLASQRHDRTGQAVPWVLLVLAGAVFGALVAVVTSRQIGKRRSP
jgi:hypothetical protein